MLYIVAVLGKGRRGLALRASSGTGRRRQGANASCESGQVLEKAQNGNGRLLEKVGMDLGLAPRPLGVGATSVWVWRRAPLGSAPPRRPRSPQTFTATINRALVEAGVNALKLAGDKSPGETQ
jgi:hypothetical protein